MTRERQPAASGSRIAELREHAQLVASHLPGPLRLLRMRAGDVSIEVQWHEAASPGPPGPPDGNGQAGQQHGAGQQAIAGNGQQGPAANGDGGEPLALVTAPMVGTFYQAPSPGADPFVSAGDLVEPGQTVGIVEAMKLMNSVTAECAGRVAEVLVADAQPVEFGQPLVAIDVSADDGGALPGTGS
jgi:acetyl-CoA carboxylase biotin carboxyl carrier protein